MSGSTSKHQRNVCIYAVVDDSGSMEGSKIQSVCSTIQDMFNTWPDSVLFDVTLFSNKAEKAFTALKSKLDIHEIVKKIEEKCAYGEGTALYDAWGDMLTSIPESVFAREETQMFVLTDGEDNMSSRYTLSDVLALTKQRTTSRTQFTLIDVGKSNLQLTQSIKTMGKRQIQAIDVDNNANSIKSALQSVNKDILTSIRSTQQPQKSNDIKNRINNNQSQYSLLSTTRKPTSSVAPIPTHSSTNAAGMLTTSKKVTSSSAINKSSHPNDTSNTLYVLK